MRERTDCWTTSKFWKSGRSSNPSSSFWIQATGRSCRRFAIVNRSTTKLRESWRKSSKQPKKNSKAIGDVKPNHAEPVRYSPTNPVCQKYAAVDEGDEDCFS